MTDEPSSETEDHPGKAELDSTLGEVNRIAGEIDACITAIDGDARHLTTAKGTSIGVGVTNLRGYCGELCDVIKQLEGRIEELEEQWSSVRKDLTRAEREIEKRRLQAEDFRNALCLYVAGKKRKKWPDDKTERRLESIRDTVNGIVEEENGITHNDLEKVLG